MKAAHIAHRCAIVILAAHVAHADNVLVRPWGENTLRIQIAPSSWTLTDELPTAYLPGPPHAPLGAPASQGHFSFSPDRPSDLSSGASVTSGNIRVAMDSEGLLTITRVSDGKTLLRESARVLGSDGDASVTFDFSSSSSKLYGMGQNRLKNNGAGLGLNVVNQTYSFQGSIGEEGGPSNSLPWVLGAEPQQGGFQFGVLFNSPALGGAAFNESSMIWSIIADAGHQGVRQQFDFLVTTHAATAKDAEKPFQMIEKYVDAVGHAPKMPYPGYWHSRNRYRSQDELLEVARGFHNRSIPVDVIVIDYYHWKIMGDWSFDESKWPDPKAMVDECRSYGIEIMVSVWPFSCPGSRSYDTVVKNGWISTYVAENGTRTNIGIETHGNGCRHVDATNPDFRKYVWSMIESGYYQYGIKIYWLDASEPEGFGPLSVNASWSAGTMRDIGSMFTLYWTQAFYDGLRSHGETDIVMLPRAGWVGTWRHGAVLWSGDIGSTMSVLKGQLNIGLSAQSSGIPFWTTDIGGYRGGNAEDPVYRETIVRWFQYGFTCPFFRQHGARDHTAPWFYGADDEKMITDLIRLRSSMLPYFKSQLDALNETGRPFNRPLMWDFPGDPKTWELAEGGIGDQSSSEPTPGSMQDGDWVTLQACNASRPWNQRWINTSGTLRLADPAAGTRCLDNGGHNGAPPPTGPYPVHMWTCASTWARAQTWVYNVSTKALSDPSESGTCLSSGTEDDKGTHPNMQACDPTDTKQQWSFESNDPSAGYQVTNGDGKCLSVALQSAAGATSVADQYMMGDDYMAAPVLNQGQRSRQVYFPQGASWVHHYTGTTYAGGTTANVDAPLDTFPLFKRMK